MLNIKTAPQGIIAALLVAAVVTGTGAASAYTFRLPTVDPFPKKSEWQIASRCFLKARLRELRKRKAFDSVKCIEAKIVGWKKKCEDLSRGHRYSYEACLAGDRMCTLYFSGRLRINFIMMPMRCRRYARP